MTGVFVGTIEFDDVKMGWNDSKMTPPLFSKTKMCDMEYRVTH